MKKTPISTSNAPRAIGTYSQAVKVGDTVYLSGQIPLVPQTMELESGDMRAQIALVFENLAAVAHAAGASLQDAVKLNIYLTDLTHFALVNEAMAQRFKEPYPARATIGVAALPKGAAVEMDAVLVLGQPVKRKTQRKGGRSSLQPRVQQKSVAPVRRREHMLNVLTTASGSPLRSRHSRILRSTKAQRKATKKRS